MIRLSTEDINNTYTLITEYHTKFLDNNGVKLPHLIWRNSYTKAALTLVYLAYGYPNTRIVSKAELTEFIRSFFSDANDVQQGRQLATQSGWFILSGTRNDITSEHIPEGSYKLVSLEQSYPGFNPKKRDDSITEDYWEDLKKSYGYRCACCGSQEGQPHRYWKSTKTVLQKGHMDPNKALEPGNIIPQCEKCNRPDLNYWVYDRKGRVVSLANPAAIEKSTLQIQKEVYSRLYAKFGGKPPKH